MLAMTSLNVGDVFTVPLGDRGAGVGQVVGTYGKSAFFFAIFETVLPVDRDDQDAVAAVAAPVLFVALSMDAKIHAGHWHILGFAPVAKDVPLPVYKEAVASPPRFDVVDYSGTRRRHASATEAQMLPYRKVVAPVRLEKALRAWLGMEPWLDVYDELRSDRLIATRNIFG